MTIPVADDYSSIAARMAEIKKEREEEPDCPRCEGGGWIMYGIGQHDPHFRKCDVCFNPKDLPSP